jgi:hypothetical protein
MSLTLAANPPLVHFCKNGLLFKASPDNLFSQTGHKAFFSLYKTGNLIAGDTIIFEWATHSVTLTAVSNPDDSGYQIKAGGSNSLVFNAIISNYLLSKYYNIILAGDYDILFEARDTGDDYSMSLTLNTSAYQ